MRFRWFGWTLGLVVLSAGPAWAQCGIVVNGVTQCGSVTFTGTVTFADGSTATAAGPTFALPAVFSAPNLITTATPGVTLSNPTLATAAVPGQYSPDLVLMGTAWDTVGLVSHAVSWRTRVQPSSSSPISGDLFFDYYRDGAVVQAGALRMSSSALILGSANALVQAGSGRLKIATNGIAQLTNTSNAPGLELNYGSAAPTVTSCGTGSVTTHSTNSAGQITATGATACTLTFGAPAWTNTPFCVFMLANAPTTTPYISAASATAVTFSGLTAGDVGNYVCLGGI